MLVRDNYQLASTKIPEGASQFPPRRATDLLQASTYWQRYVKVVGARSSTRRSLAWQASSTAPRRSTSPRTPKRRTGSSPSATNDVNSYAAARLGRHDRGRHANGRARHDQGAGPRAERTAQGSPEAAQGDQETGAGPGMQAGSRQLSRLSGLAATRKHPDTLRREVNFHIEDEAIDDVTHVIELGGEVDLYTAPEFKERMVELIEAGKKQIVVDLSQGDVHRLDDARRARGRRQAAAPGRRLARARLHGRQHHQDLRDHGPGPGLPDPRARVTTPSPPSAAGAAD